MALTVYTTFMTDWTSGQSGVLSTHVTEQSAQRRLIDCIYGELKAYSEYSHCDLIEPKLLKYLEKYNCSWDDWSAEVKDLEREQIERAFEEIQEFQAYYDKIAWHHYNVTTLEG